MLRQHDSSTLVCADRRKHRPKICVLVPHHWAAGKGGSEYQASVLIDFLLRNYDVEITYLALEAPAIAPLAYRIIGFSSRRGIRRYGSFFDAFRLYRALARESPDVIYQQVGCAHTGIAAYYAKRKGCRMFWRVASDSDVTKPKRNWLRPHHIIERWFLEYGIRNASVIIAQTEQQKRLLAANYRRPDPIVVYNFHPTPSDSEMRQAPASDKKVILWVANVKALKKPEAFIRLAASFTERHDAEFIMIGGSQGSDAWLSKIAEMIESVPNLRHLGELSQEEVNAILRRSHVLVNTSDYEGFSNTFVQAWMRGVPVVSLNVNPDSLLDGRGVGFISGSEEQLHKDVAKLLEDPTLARSMGERGRALALREFSEVNIKQIARLLGLELRREAQVALTCCE